ncbi:MAG: penicillin-binding transpeptidase domain-containing protein [Anaeromicrobium sp.]|uniref:peptidoglycan D,D-transpeptidase FtsI family protein n=1 Tax=Anaeromicrobium sp. TaxID=1929132 RepID=UPI0025CE2E47|nr:penicillin-binding transpeptidase domain-containing protein [Anaeromicrobium sp.]MCT4595149.1 penicillin-binding transpeptidase domain-containing protein [Anaeromicrobium sp.]
MNIISKRIIKVLLLFCIMYLGLILNLSYIEIFKVDEIINNPYNKRLWIKEDNILRGKILDRNKVILADNNENDDKIRRYPFGNTYSHIIGYSFKEYGKSGLEKSFNKVLLGFDKSAIERVRDTIIGGNNKGNNLILTIDHEIQSHMEKRMRGKKGAVVAMNPKTGEIYGLVSKPDFNPNELVENWKAIANNENSPLLNRAAQGLYTPGSVFKLVTATSALNYDLNPNYVCEGQITIDGFVLKDYKNIAHKEVDMRKALTYSCNVAFAQMGLDLGYNKIKKTGEKYMFNRDIYFDITTKNSVFPTDRRMSKVDLGSLSIGQGKLLVTPINMAMVTSAIGNDGDIMRPYLVKEITDSRNRIIELTEPKPLSNVISPYDGKKLTNMMIDVVQFGTGKRAQINGVKVAGKTGTAQTNSKSHDWFVGFAPANDPKVTVVVVLENEGKGGGVSAAPIARDILKNALNVLNK